MKQRDDATEIEIPSRAGLRGRMDRLAQEYTKKAAALQIAIDIIDADDRQTALEVAPKKFLQAINHRQSAAPVARRKHKKTQVPRVERLAAMTRYLAEHPGASTREIAAALDISSNRVTTLAPEIAKATGGEGSTPSTWTLKGTRTAARSKRKIAPKLPRQERLDQIQGFLQRHPEAITSEIAKAVGLKANSSLVKLLREVAHPARPTIRTQPINWVLNP